MRFLQLGDNTKELEILSKGHNKWRWAWVSECDSDGDKWGLWLKKPDIPGIAYCECCVRTLKYSGGGKKDLKRHAEDPAHKKAKTTVKTKQVSPGSSSSTEEHESMEERVARQHAITVAFLCEHSLPFSLAPKLLDLALRLSEDKETLDLM